MESVLPPFSSLWQRLDNLETSCPASNHLLLDICCMRSLLSLHFILSCVPGRYISKPGYASEQNLRSFTSQRTWMHNWSTYIPFPSALRLSPCWVTPLEIHHRVTFGSCTRSILYLCMSGALGSKEPLSLDLWDCWSWENSVFIQNHPELRETFTHLWVNSLRLFMFPEQVPFIAFP